MKAHTRGNATRTNKTPGPTKKNVLFDSSNIIYRIPEEQHQMSKKETVNQQNEGNTEHLNNEEESQVGIRT